MDEGSDMSSNRNIRNPQQLRSLIQNMGRSIDEARSRRLGPQSPVDQRPAQQGDMRFEQAAASSPAQMAPRADTVVRPIDQAQPQSPSSAAPPVRGANEMFDPAAPRLKARPKRAS
jgi:hypothetical protein